MTRDLLRQLDQLRQAIQSDLDSPRLVSRGDVVRLALRRLVLAYYAYLSETGVSADLSDAYQDTVTAIRADGFCPSWLVPGRAETAPAKPKKKGR